jgi:hypothetical protein
LGIGGNIEYFSRYNAYFEDIIRKKMSKKLFTGRNGLWFLFLISVFIRFLFIWLYKKDGFEYIPADSTEYGRLMEKALSGDFNFDLGRFVRAPFYPFLMAIYKIVFDGYWQHALITSQVLLSSIVTIYTALIAGLVFRKENIAFIAGLFASLYLPVFYYAGAFSTEIVYLFFYVAGTYYFLLFQNHFGLMALLKSSLLFALCFMTRSEILFYLPFLMLSCWHYTKNKRVYFWMALGSIVFFIEIFSIPWGLYNLREHGTYIASSNGGKYVFYLGNSEIGYLDGVKPPPAGSKEYEESREVANMGGAVYDSIINLPQSKKQDVFLLKAIEWMKYDPGKWALTKAVFLMKFFIPGVSWHHHSFSSWLFSFLIGIPIYVLCFVGVRHAFLHESFWEHTWFYGKFISSLFFLVGFLFVQRFRVYSIEIFYLIYAAKGFEIVCDYYWKPWKKYLEGKKPVKT